MKNISMNTVAVLIPCFNEEKSIAQVVRDFRTQLPDAAIYVFDNNSTDNTAREARKAGAVVEQESRQGKGYVMRSMFRQIEADIYVMVDGDGTYPADRVHALIQPVAEGKADMTIGSRLHPLSKSSFKYLHLTGNRFFLFVLNKLFRMHISDLLSGYRALSRQTVKSLPILSRGFEIEAEMTIKCFERGYRISEIPVNLSIRQEGSKSKINIVKDGFLILNTVFTLTRDYKPLTVFGSIALILLACGLAAGFTVTREYLLTGGVHGIQLTIVSAGFLLSAIISFSVGLILHSISRHFQEQHQMLQNILMTNTNKSR